MLVGKPPFRDKTEYLTFELIKEGHVNYSEIIDQNAQDFIKILLKQEPYERAASDGNFSVLKNHKFLQDLDVDNIFSQHVPVLSPPTTLPRQVISQNQLDEVPSLHFFNSSGGMNLLPINLTSGTQIIHEGLIMKRGEGMTGFIFRKRLLRLTIEPRLMYFDPEKDNKYKGDILISPKMKAEVVDDKKFNIVTPKRTYIMKVRFDIKEIQNSPNVWVDVINNFVKQYFKPKNPKKSF